MQDESAQIAEQIEIQTPRALWPLQSPPATTNRVVETDLDALDTEHLLPATPQHSAEMIALERRFARGARLMQIVGPRRSGKSRLAQQFTHTPTSHKLFASGHVKCDLSDTTELAEAIHILARALSLHLQPGNPLSQDLEHIGEALRARGRFLLVIHSPENLPEDMSATLKTWRKTSPETSFLLTTAQKLSLRGGMLSLPESTGKSTNLTPDAWTKLHKTERRTLMAFSVFAGSFGTRAAEHMLRSISKRPAPRSVLRTLRHKDLLNLSRTHGNPAEVRYKISNAVRSLAAEHLEQDADLKTHVYASFLAFCTSEEASSLQELHNLKAAGAHTNTREERAALVLNQHRALDRHSPWTLRQTILDLQPVGPLRPHILLAQGETLMLAQEPQKAIEHFAQIPAEHPLYAQARFGTCRALLDMHQHEEAAQTLQNPVLSLDAECALLQGRLAEIHQDPQLAHTCYVRTQQTAQRPGQEAILSEAYARRSMLYAQEGEPEKAQISLSRARALCPLGGSVDLLHEAALAILENHPYKSSSLLELFETAIGNLQGNRTNFAHLRRLQASRAASGDPRKALTLLQEAASAARHNPALLDTIRREKNEITAQLDHKNTTTLSIGQGGAWFSVDGQKKADLSRRKPLRRILAHLARMQERHPGQSRSVRQLMAAGWPGERMLLQSGADRVYNAIRTLRKFGLHDLLQTQGGGYLLDPECVVTLCDH